MAKQKEKKNITFEEKLEQALVPVDDQPYEVPQNWCWVRMGKIIDLISGRDSSNKDCNDKGIGIPYILGASNLENNYFTVERWIEKPVVTSIKNDILISVKGTVGKLYIQKENVINISRQIMAIRVKNNLKVKYTYLYLKSITDRLKSDGYGLIPGIPREILLNKEIPLPPLPEQQRIVDLIERLFAKLDEAKEKVQTAIDSFELRKAAILHKAFTGELTKAWRAENGKLRDENGELEKTPSVSHTLASSSTCVGAHLKDCHNRSDLGKDFRFKQDAPPEFLKKIAGGAVSSLTEGVLTNSADQTNANTTEGLPLGWKKEFLSNICTINPPKIKTKDFSDEIDVSFIPMNALSEKEGAITIFLTRKLKEVKNGFTNFIEGDVVFAKITPCMENGKSAIIGKLVNNIGYGTTEFYVLRCSNLLNNRYLHYILRDTIFRKKAKSVMTGSVGQQRVPKSFLENYQIPLPPLPEQKEIVRILDTLLAKSDKAKELAENSLENIETLKKTILAKAFRGLLGTNRAEEASSLELLKEVL